MSAATQELGILDISNAEHHALRALSNSGMKDLAVSPLRYWFNHVNPAPKPDEEESAALRMGSALHCAVLESEETFEARYARALDPSDWPVCLDTNDEICSWIKSKGGIPATKNAAGKPAKKSDWTEQAVALMGQLGEYVPILEEEKRRFFAANQGKTIMPVDEWERLAGMAGALADESALKPIFREGRPEVTITARDPETGVLLKARLDWMAPGVTLDIKTMTVKRGCSVDRSVSDAIWNEKYYVQMYFYDMVRRLATGEGHDRIDHVLAMVESDQPHETRIKLIQPKTGGSVNMLWETARIEVRSMIRLYADCLATYGDSPWRETQKISVLADEDIRGLAWA